MIKQMTTTAGRLTRREILAGGVSLVAGVVAGSGAPHPAPRLSPKSRKVLIRDVAFEFEEFPCRAPYEFGGVAVDRVTLLNVHVTVEAARGRLVKGFGSMPLGNVWPYPSSSLPYGQTLGAMKALAVRIARITHQYTEPGHPIEIHQALESRYFKEAEELSREPGFDQPIPKLAVLVAASAFDAAIHDAYGKAHSRSCYQTYGPEFLRKDLSHFLNDDFKGEHLDQYVLKEPKPRVALYHTIGGADALTEGDLSTRVNDGLPETLPEWIAYNGLMNFKLQLDGNNQQWDIDRIVQVDRIVTETQRQRGVGNWGYSLDFNERCPSGEYPLEVLRKVKDATPAGFERIQHIEQPTERDLATHRSNTVHEVAKLCPVVADESLIGLESLLLAREVGYTGVALKACKGQSQTMLMAAAAQKFGMFLCVEDLTCPGASLVQSASIAAHVPGADTLEANARQYVPAANKEWKSRFPGLFVIKDGTMNTSSLNAPGLGAV